MQVSLLYRPGSFPHELHKKRVIDDVMICQVNHKLRQVSKAGRIHTTWPSFIHSFCRQILKFTALNELYVQMCRHWAKHDIICALVQGSKQRHYGLLLQCTVGSLWCIGRKQACDLGTGVVVFPGTPICQQCDRWGRAPWRGGILGRKRHAIQSKGMFECCGEWTLACY